MAPEYRGYDITNPHTDQQYTGTYWRLSNKFYILGDKIIVPDDYNFNRTLTDDLDLRNDADFLNLENPLPNYFVINKENCVIYLHDSYCPIGIKEITIEQDDTHKAQVYDASGVLIFNGSDKSSGKYKIRFSFDCGGSFWNITTNDVEVIL